MNATVTPETAAKYDAILNLEQEVRLVTAIRDFQGAGAPNYRREQQATAVEDAKRRLYLAVDSLTDEEAAHFLGYRQGQ